MTDFILGLDPASFRRGRAALCRGVTDQAITAALHAATSRLQREGMWDGLVGTLAAFAEMELEANLETAERILHYDATVPRPTGQTKQVVHGTPITPLSALARLAPTSFCISYWNRRPIEPYLQRLAPDGLLILDNGAFTVWCENKRRALKGISPIILDATYWAGFYAWALGILRREPRAVLIIPDVIEGSPAANRQLILEVPPEVPLDRCLPVWHLDEPLEQLEWILDGFGHIAFGSSGPYGTPNSMPWRQRMAEAFDLIDARVADPDGGHYWPRIHMLRGLRPMQDGEWPLTSGDSTNLAQNHKTSYPGPGGIEAFQARIEQHAYPDPPVACWPHNSADPHEPDKLPRLARPIQIDLLIGACEKQTA